MGPSRVMEWSPQRLAEHLCELGQERAWLAFDPACGAVRASHPLLDELAAAQPDWAEHEAVFLQASRAAGTLLAAFVHCSVRGQAQGGLRLWRYHGIDAFLRDGLRLSRGMTRKSALAGLWWGGGKGIIAAPARELQPEQRTALYREYGRFVSSLCGCYVTAEDVGTSPLDVAELFRTTRFVTCIPHESGGSANPAPRTAAGVVCAMEAALEFRGMGPLAGRTVAVQGAGQVGSALIGLLLERGVARIVADELSGERRSAVLDHFAGRPVEVRDARPGEPGILAEPCDVLAPCALGGVLDAKSIPHVRAPIVCGAANNPLRDEERDAAALHERGITYVPDYVANRMGIVACANEQYGAIESDPAILRHLGRDWPDAIHPTTLRVLEQAEREGITPSAAAARIADARAAEPHPVWGHRAQQIVRSLVEGRWVRGCGETQSP